MILSLVFACLLSFSISDRTNIPLERTVLINYPFYSEIKEVVLTLSFNEYIFSLSYNFKLNDLSSPGYILELERYIEAYLIPDENNILTLAICVGSNYAFTINDLFAIKKTKTTVSNSLENRDFSLEYFKYDDKTALEFLEIFNDLKSVYRSIIAQNTLAVFKSDKKETKFYKNILNKIKKINNNIMSRAYIK